MAAVEGFVVLVEKNGEASFGDAIWSIQRWNKRKGATPTDEEAKEWRLAVVVAEAALESGIGDEAAPTLADEGGPGEGGRPRGQAEENLPKHVVVVWQRGRRRGGAAAAGGRHLPSRAHGRLSSATPPGVFLMGDLVGWED